MFSPSINNYPHPPKSISTVSIASKSLSKFHKEYPISSSLLFNSPSNMASISSPFNCLSSSRSLAINSNSFAPVTSVSFSQKKLRPISAVCAAAAPPVAEKSSTASFYELLGVQSGASCQEIKTAYRRLARVLHPDVVGQNDVASASDFIRVHEAYATLSDPGKRADYDSSLFVRRRFIKGSNPSFNSSSGVSNGRARGPTASRSTRRSWETDQCW